VNFKTVAIAAAALALPAGAAVAQEATPATDAHAGHTQAEAQATTSTPAAGAVVAATKEDIKAGLAVLDQQGGSVGTVESVTDDGAIVSTGSTRVQLPFNSFGKNDQGLVIGMTKSELEAAAKGG